MNFRLCVWSMQTPATESISTCSTLSPKFNMFNSIDFVKNGGAIAFLSNLIRTTSNVSNSTLLLRVHWATFGIFCCCFFYHRLGWRWLWFYLFWLSVCLSVYSLSLKRIKSCRWMMLDNFGCVPVAVNDWFWCWSGSRCRYGNFLYNNFTTARKVQFVEFCGISRLGGCLRMSLRTSCRFACFCYCVVTAHCDGQDVSK